MQGQKMTFVSKLNLCIHKTLLLKFFWFYYIFTIKMQSNIACALIYNEIAINLTHGSILTSYTRHLNGPDLDWDEADSVRD